ncbi:solute carrier family 27 (fatty acid transporter), member, partial [mine drainage metagenome]
EGNVSLYNCEGKAGSIGRIPPVLAHRYPVAIVRFEPDTLLPARDAAGRCLRCAPDEAGEAIGQILGGAEHANLAFEGYADTEATERKIARDVFAPGDAWYRTGDLMTCDEKGFFYFVDRIGDTFRWKGENVSTTEVASILTKCRGVVDAAVYGVSVPGAEGRAG